MTGQTGRADGRRSAGEPRAANARLASRSGQCVPGRASPVNSVLALVAVCFLTACRAESAPGAEEQVAVSCDESAARAVVERMGQQLRQVSLLADDSIVRRQIREAYAPLLASAWVLTRCPAGPPGL